MTITCTRCGEQKPESEFHRDSSSPYGRRKQCKLCRKPVTRAHYERNRDRVIEAQRKYRKENAVAISYKDRARYRRDKDRRLAWQKAYYEANKPTIHAYQAKHRDEHRETHNALQRRWRQKNLQHVRAYHRLANHRYRALKSLDGVTASLAEGRVAYYGGKCWICREAPYEELDHVKPLSKGGPHMLSNLRPACRACNRRKSSKWPFRENSRAASALVSTPSR